VFKAFRFEKAAYIYWGFVPYTLLVMFSDFHMVRICMLPASYIFALYLVLCVIGNSKSINYAKLGGMACCYMADPEVAAAAKEAGTTRAVAAMKKAAQEHPGAILAVGNAPTALLTIAEQIENGLRPALVIGVPVGFVNVVESKERLFAVCEKHGVPAIAAMGRKGGSNVAAAICNALIYSAAEMLDPSARGWK